MGPPGFHFLAWRDIEERHGLARTPHAPRAIEARRGFARTPETPRAIEACHSFARTPHAPRAIEERPGFAGVLRALGGMGRHFWAPHLVVLMLGACAGELKPAPGTMRVEGRGQGAAAQAAGVRMVVRAGAWHSSPTTLELVVTPILVMIENESAAPLRVRYADFALVGPAGQRFAPRAPFEVEGYVAEPLPGYAAPRLFHPRFYVLRDAQGRAVAFDPFWYDPFFDAWRFASVALPTADMVQMALPERVVEPHGRATGFVYFERVRKVARVDFTARLVDDRSGDPLGTLTIPFVVE